MGQTGTAERSASALITARGPADLIEIAEMHARLDQLAEQSVLYSAGAGLGSPWELSSLNHPCSGWREGVMPRIRRRSCEEVVGAVWSDIYCRCISEGNGH